MGKLTFGKKPSMGEKTAMAMKKSYDSGKPSTGSSGPTKWKAKPDISKKKFGVKIKRKI